MAGDANQPTFVAAVRDKIESVPPLRPGAAAETLPRPARITIAVVCYALASMLTVFANKAVVGSYGFRFIFTLIAMQNGCAIAVIYAVARLTRGTWLAPLTRVDPLDSGVRVREV